MLRTTVGLAKAALLATAVTTLALGAAADESHDHAHGHGAPEALGTVHFAVTCTREAQQGFDHAMALQHSFWYQAAEQAFEQVLTQDRGCVMAYWGIAMSQLYNPFSIPLSKGMKDGAAALAKAVEIGAKSPRETDYIAALGVLYRDFATVDRRVRVTGYADAMGALAARYPTTARLRFSTRWRSTSPRRRPTRPTRTSSKPPRFSRRRSPSSPIIRASRII